MDTTLVGSVGRDIILRNVLNTPFNAYLRLLLFA